MTPSARWHVPRSRRLDSVSIAAFRSFAFVAETGGFSSAARILGLSVSTVSKHIDAIETRLQTALLLRTTRRVTLTEAGVAFYQQCREFLEELDEAAEARFSPHELHGRLRVISPPSFTSRVLSKALPTFLNRHPKLRVELRVTTATAAFMRDEVDLAIRMTSEHTNGDRIERVGAAPSLLCAAPRYLAEFGVPQRPEDLSSHRCLGGINSPYGEHWRFQVRDESLTLPIRNMFVCDNGDVLRDICLDGQGIGGFFFFHVRDEIESGSLVPLLTDYQADVSSVYIVRPATRYSPPQTEAFIAFVKELWCGAG